MQHTARSEDGWRSPVPGKPNRLLLAAATLVVSVAGVECGLRIRGYTPFNPYAPGIVKVEPENRMFEIAPVLGYRNIPGTHNVLMTTGHRWTATILADSSRATSTAGTRSADDSRSEIWLAGCSELFGWSVSDEETIAWLVQAKFPNLRIVNLGTAGYGSVSSYLQVRERLATSPVKPVAILYQFGSFHTARNVFGQGMRKVVMVWNQLGPMQIPFARLDEQDRLMFSAAPPIYQLLPGAGMFALPNLLDDYMSSSQDGDLRGVDVTTRLLAEFDELARQNGARFLVAGLDRHPLTKRLVGWLASVSIASTSFDMDLLAPEDMNLPHDIHRSSRANRILAQKMTRFLETTLATQPPAKNRNAPYAIVEPATGEKR